MHNLRTYNDGEGRSHAIVSTQSMSIAVLILPFELKNILWTMAALVL